MLRYIVDLLGKSFYNLYRRRKGTRTAWGNSLFEDNAEFGYGMKQATLTLRARLEVQ